MTSILQCLKSQEELWAGLGVLSAQTEIKAAKRSIRILLHSPEICFALVLPSSPGRKTLSDGSSKAPWTCFNSKIHFVPSKVIIAKVNMTLAVLCLGAFER